MAHDGSHIGEICPDCGTHHRVLESIPAQPLTRSALESIEDSDGITFARGIGWFYDGTSDGDDETTEDIVLGTQKKALLLSLYQPGWVVDLEAEPREDEDETVEDVARDLWMQSSQGLSEAMHEML